MNEEIDPPDGGGQGHGGHRPAGNGGSAELLGEMAALRRRARSARHAYWFPLVLFGVLICAAVPFYHSASAIAGDGPGHPAVAVARTASGTAMPLLGQTPFHGSFFLGYYWLVALVGGYLISALWYRRRGRLAGLQTPARGYVVTGVVLTVAALLLPPLSQFRALQWLSVLWPGDLVARGTFPFIIIAAGLWVLAWAERSRGLAVTALGYSGAALLASLYNVENLLFRLGWNPGIGDLWQTSLINLLLPAAVLLGAGAVAGAAAAAQRRRAAA